MGIWFTNCSFSNKDKQETNTINRKVGEYSENDKKEW